MPTPIVINGLDNEFGTSTGANVNSGPDRSDFDYPPTATKDLVITSNPEDLHPYTFEVGDTYDLSWGGMGGNRTIEDAQVIRSDFVSSGGDDGHIVVFEGTDSNGALTQIVWTPDFDLETWYFDNFSEGVPPQFFNSDVDDGTSYAYVCFTPGALITVPGGFRVVEALTAGDLVTTWDNGPQPLRWTGRREISGRGEQAPVLFEPGSLGNARPLRLSPQHRILYSGGDAELMFGASEVLVPAKAFVGLPGIRRDPAPRVTYLHLLFDRHELVAAEDVVCESLLLGDMALGSLRPPEDDAAAEAGAILPEVMGMVDHHGMRAARPVLKVREAAALLGMAPPRIAAPATL